MTKPKVASAVSGLTGVLLLWESYPCGYGGHVTGGYVCVAFDIQHVFLVISGIIVIVSAVMLYWKPQRHVVWGILIIVFSVFNFFLIFNVIPGLVGGILAIIWKPSAT
ncbi:MAG: hypothetical protein ACLPY5_14145 [Candidatus Bathyarchaeia archaeon]